MDRRPFLAGNWKMHTTRAQARELVSELLSSLAGVNDRDIALAPPFTALQTVSELVAESPIRLAAQNLYWESKGAFTGEISASMLTDLGCRFVIIGHSERRQYFAETDDTVNQRIASACKAGLSPIVCVGELLSEREAGRTLTVIERQIHGALKGFSPDLVAGLTIAYEPVWAIGTGKTASPQEAQEVHAAIRKIVKQLTTAETADQVRILYGGSVKPDNIDNLMVENDIDGALVGGASLDAASFTRIVRFERRP